MSIALLLWHGTARFHRGHRRSWRLVWIWNGGWMVCGWCWIDSLCVGAVDIVRLWADTVSV